MSTQWLLEGLLEGHTWGVLHESNKSKTVRAPECQGKTWVDKRYQSIYLYILKILFTFIWLYKCMMLLQQEVNNL